MENKKALLEIRHMKKYFPIEQGISKRKVGEVRAVDDVNITLYEGEVVGVVGESGCGKTTLGRCILRILEPTDGEVIFHINGETIDFTHLDKKAVRALRKHIQMVFQNPYTSLNPRMTVFDIVAEPLRLMGDYSAAEIESRVTAIIERVGLEKAHLNRYPHAFSGGQRQRIGIARALVTQPSFVIADEAVSALDVSIQAQILNLLQDLKDELNLTYMFIAHNLSVVEHISDRICVMYLGRVVEMGETEALFRYPLHPYTEVLLSAIPIADPNVKKRRIVAEGEIEPRKSGDGCCFAARCRYATERCQKEIPQFRENGEAHYVACHYAETLQLQGIGGSLK